MRHPVTRGIIAAFAVMALMLGGVPSAAAADPPSPGPGTMIVGGTPATQTRGAVAFYTAGPNFRCGGILIDEEWALTAGHCTHEAVVPGETQARAGSLQWAAGGTQVGVALAIPNPGFTGENPIHDIALVRFDQSVSHPPVSLGLNPGGVGTVSLTVGWGNTCDLDVTDPVCWESIAPNLQQLNIRRLSGESCPQQDPAGGEFFRPSSMLCLMSADGQPRSPCFGDSGGPVVRNGNVVALIVGDADSFELHPNICTTAPDGTVGKGLATKIANYLPWILHTLYQHDPEAAFAVASRVH